MSKKYFLALILALCVAFALFACGDVDFDIGGSTNPSQTQEVTESTGDPTEPSNSTEPTQPSEPTQPTEPDSPTEPSQPTTPAPEDTAPTTQMGTVKVNESLNIRKGPGTDYDIVGTLRNGDRVEILEQKVVSSMTWGRISQGWISLDYVVLDTPTESTPAPAPTPTPTPTPEPDPDPETTPMVPGSLTYEEYMALSGAEQYAYFCTFDTAADFNNWYNTEKAKWEASQNKEVTNGNITLDQ